MEFTNSPAEAHFLIRLTRLVGADPDRHLGLQSLEEIEQLVGGEAAEVSVHKVGDFRLFDPEQRRDLSLWQLLGFEDLLDVEADFGACEQFVAILQT
jgi:hypothetical protein